MKISRVNLITKRSSPPPPCRERLMITYMLLILRVAQGTLSSYPLEEFEEMRKHSRVRIMSQRPVSIVA